MVMTDENFCIVCCERHDDPRLVRSHERAAAEYEAKYGVSI